MSSEFLSDQERKQLQKIYQVWNRNLKADVIAGVLFGEGFLSEHEKARFDHASPVERSSQLFHNVLMKSTYSQIQKIRRILFDEDHQALAQSLVRRTDDVLDPDIRDWFPGVKSAAMQAHHQPMDQTSYSQYTNGPQTQHPPAANPNPQSKNQPSPSSEMSFSHSEEAHSASKADPSHYIGNTQQPAKLESYAVKQPEQNPYGNGLVVILANFTGDLTGYEKDIENIKHFFTTNLKYDVNSQIEVHKNLCQEQFMTTLKDVQTKLKNEKSIDRLFVFILSHGDENGVKMVERASDKCEETVDEKPLYVNVEDIVNMFTHDQVLNLKDFPKCFYLQTCQGYELAKAASNSCLQGLEGTPRPKKITVGADVLVYKASCPDTMSFVPDGGSWFINILMGVFMEYHGVEDMVSMITEVNKLISGKKCKTETSSGVYEWGRQMPVFTSTLRKKFFLTNPQ